MKPLNPNRRIQEKQASNGEAAGVMKKPAAMVASPLKASDRAQELLKKAEDMSMTALPEGRYGQKEQAKIIKGVNEELRKRPSGESEKKREKQEGCGTWHVESERLGRCELVVTPDKSYIQAFTADPGGKGSWK